MANKTLELTDRGAARYRTRMLKAGDAVTLSGPQARLYEALGWGVEQPATDKPQLDHDHDGKPGDSLKGPRQTKRRGKVRAQK